MKTKRFSFALTLFAFILVFISSCKKDENTSTTPIDESVIKQSVSMLSFLSNDMLLASYGQNTGAQTLKSGQTLEFPLAPCATITFNTQTTPYTKIIDFGSANCLCQDGKTRRGKIIVKYTLGDLLQTGAAFSLTFDNYYENDNLVNGTSNLTFSGLSAALKPKFSLVVDKVIKLANGETHAVKANQTFTWAAGYSTLLDITDDVLEITGTATYVDAKGVSRSFDVVSALKKIFSCNNLVSGSFVIKESGKADVTINLGDGSCDNTATYIVNGETKSFTF